MTTKQTILSFTVALFSLSICLSIRAPEVYFYEMAPERFNQRECKTYGSGVVQPFNGSAYHVRTSCSVTLLHFTHLGVDCDITIQRGLSGLLTRVEAVVNKIRTVVLDGTIAVENHRFGLSPSSHRALANPPQLISEAVLEDDTCVVEDSLEDINNMVCGEFMSHAVYCLASEAMAYFYLCGKNAYGHAGSSHVTCPFFWDIALRSEPQCPGQLTYEELGNAFIPTCSNPTPTPRASDQDMTSTCVCPQGQVLNDRASGHSCVSVEECPCVYGSSSYPPGSYRRTKCQTCYRVNGKWQCSEDICPKTCSIESKFVTSFDGKHFRLPGKCTYVAAKWYDLICKIIQMSGCFSALVTVFWQSSMYVQVQVLSGLSIQVQMSPEIQVYLSLAEQHSGTTEGLCGNFNGDSSDDFTTSSGIVENSAEPFALSWSVESCVHDIPDICTNVDNKIFADEHCNQLRDPNGIFGSCHSYVPYDQYYQACISKTCQCHSELQSCLCVALGNYAKACASVGAFVGDWRTVTNCTVTCMTNQVFDYTTRVCNRTCRSLAGRDPTCDLEAEPAEGCGCREGTYLNDHSSCSPRSHCPCHHIGGATPPGPVVIDGRAW
ncbi:mucin-6-like [Clupea harengus]|uniref:Mucin-6-like n=1 Tax=Clupea harengus TaxID=7950 RepID=A0A6P8GJR5_CLUHA|nr:mucin-6-like [Clupea harengus]